MKIGIPKEIAAGETRVALVPPGVVALTRAGHSVVVESGAGAGASFHDEEYIRAGASVVRSAPELYEGVDIVLKVQAPQSHPLLKRHESELVRNDSTFIGMLSPLSNLEAIRMLAQKNVTSYALEYIPRITRAQSMDVLSSMATIAGYKSVLIAAHHLNKMFPLLMTAAGTIPPATVFVLGAGVAGLQAIATAKRLGARVEAFDPRPAVKEQVKSLGASFVEMELVGDVETAGGYAKEQAADFLRREMEAISARLPKVDVIITTAQIFGKRAPVLIDERMVKLLKPGSVIVDLAAEQGGNCSLTRAGETIEAHGVIIAGAVNLPAQLPIDASQMYSKNISNFLLHAFPKSGATDHNDEILRGACITRGGEIVNTMVLDALQKGNSQRD